MDDLMGRRAYDNLGDITRPQNDREWVIVIAERLESIDNHLTRLNSRTEKLEIRQDMQQSVINKQFGALKLAVVTIPIVGVLVTVAGFAFNVWEKVN